TVMPAPSMIQASAGAWTLAPTARMIPSRTTTVPFSMTGPATGTMRALVIAKCGGVSGRVGCGWAAAVVAASGLTARARRAASRPGRTPANRERIARNLLRGLVRVAGIVRGWGGGRQAAGWWKGGGGGGGGGPLPSPPARAGERRVNYGRGCSRRDFRFR